MEQLYSVTLFYNTQVNKIVSAKNRSDAIEKARYMVDASRDTFFEAEIFDNLSSGQVACTRISNAMDTTNGHNPELVEKINKIFATAPWDKLGWVMKALYYRDWEEMVDKEIFNGTEEVYLSDFDWDKYSYDYLMKVADDTDLETIIQFMR